MRSRPYPDTEPTFADRARHFGHWLTRRPLESWGFFIAGVVLASLIN